MKVCVVGAGAIGGYMAVRIAAAGHEVSVVARGPHLAAIKAHGLKLIEGDQETISADLIATEKLNELSSQDLILMALKAHQIESIVADLTSVMGAETIMVTLQNGIPWWYFQNFSGPYAGRPIRSVDPRGKLFDGIDPDCLIGCIAYPAATLAEPGVIRHVEGNRFPVGELDGSESARVQCVSALFEEAGFRSRILTDIRSEIWLKLWGNLTFNPISALTHSTLEDICRFPLTRELSANMMTEAQAIGERLGAHFRVPMEKRIAGAEAVGAHKTSMLQDVEQGKSLEIEGMLGAVIELAALTKIEAPTLKALYACVSLLDQTAQASHMKIKGVYDG